MNYLKLIISAVGSLGGSIASFISSAKATYILLAILGVGGWYMWTDYQSLREDNGKLSLALEIASSGTREAINTAEHNARESLEIKKHYQEILNELQRLDKINRELEADLSDKERAFDSYKEQSSDTFKECMRTVLPDDSFGNLVEPSGNTTIGMSNN